MIRSFRSIATSGVFLILLLCIPCVGRDPVAGSSFDTNQWGSIDGNTQSAVIAWCIEHDSRVDKDLGFTKSKSPALGTAWLSPQIARVDTFCLTAIGADGAIHPQNRDPTFCRQQFRHLLFSNRVDQPRPLPHLIPISILFEKPQAFPSKNLGALVQLSALAPVLAWNPALATTGREFEVSDRTAHYLGRQLPVLTQSSSQIAKMELWIDPENKNCIRRMTYSQEGRKAGQIDFEYQNSIPTGWSVLEFAPDGFVIDFLKIAVTNVQRKDRIDESLFQLNHPSGQLRSAEKLRTSSFRDIVSLIRSFRWLAIIPLVLALLVAFKRNRSMRFKQYSFGCACVALTIAACGYLPFAELSLRAAHDEITLLVQSIELAGESEFDREVHSADEPIKKLRYISRHISQSYNLRRSDSFFASLFGRDVAREKATLDLLKLAQFEIPKALTSEANALPHWEAIRDRLANLEQHLSSDVVSPYEPPVPISQRIEQKAIGR